MIVTNFSVSRTIVQQAQSVPRINPLYGIWSVDEFIADGVVRPPLLTDTLRWQRVIFDSEGGSIEPMIGIATIQAMNGQFASSLATIDAHKNTLVLRRPKPTEFTALTFMSSADMNARGLNGTAELTYSRPEPDRLIVEGVINGHRLHVTLKKEERPFPLTTRGFHWINNDFYSNWYHE